MKAIHKGKTPMLTKALRKGKNLLMQASWKAKSKIAV